MLSPHDLQNRTSTAFRVGAWHVDPGAHALAQDGREVRVEPKVMALLVALASRPGATFSRDELMAEVWPDVVVTEDALSRAVSKLRTALGDEASDPRYVETIPKAGYRLIAPVVVEEAVPAPGGVSRPALPSWARYALAGLAVAALVLATNAILNPAGDPSPAVRTVTFLPGLEQHPALSPDGERLAFVALSREAGRDRDLYVQGMAGASALQLTDTPEAERHPVWLADGQIGFLRCDGLACRIFVTSSVGGGDRRVSDATVGPWGLSAHPDGGMLIAAARPAPEAPYRLVTLDLRTDSLYAVTTPPDGSVGDISPVWSPDGRHVAFVRHGPDGEERILVQALDATAEPRVIVQDGVPILGVAWSSDGASLVYAANREGIDALWQVSLDGGAPERLAVTALGSPRSPTVRGQRLVYESHTTEINLYEVEPEGQLQPIILSTGVDDQPALHPAGEHLVFISNRSGAPELWTSRLDGSDLVRLTAFEGGRLGAPRWSPDGDWIAFEVQTEGSGSLYKVAADGGPVTPITDDGGYDFAPRWSPDGRFVYFGSNREGMPAVWRVDPSGGEPERMTDAGGFVGEPSLEGEALLYMRTDGPGLWRQPLQGGVAVRIDSVLGVSDWGNWAVTTTGLVLVERSSEGTRLLRLDPSTGARTVLADGLGTIPSRVAALASTPDGTRTVLARIDRIESALVLAEPVD